MTGYLLVRAGAVVCGVPVRAVQSVFDVTTIYPAPAAVPAFIGVVQHGNAMVPLVDFEALLAGRPAGETPPPTAVVVRAGNAQVALGVDDAETVGREPIEARPPGWNLDWAQGVTHRAGRWVPIVDLDVVADRLRASAGSDIR